MPLLLVWGIGGWIGLRLGLDWEILQMASRVALVPTWFLAAYVVIVTLAPPALALWERTGWWSIVAGTALAGVADLMSIGGGIVWVGFANYVLVWGTVHQLGYAWVDGRLPDRGRRAALAVVGLAGALLLVWLGPYPVAMVGLDTAQVTNSYPPRVTLVFLGMFQAGVVLLLEPSSDPLDGQDRGVDGCRRGEWADHDSVSLAPDGDGDRHRAGPHRRRMGFRRWNR